MCRGIQERPWANLTSKLGAPRCSTGILGSATLTVAEGKSWAPTLPRIYQSCNTANI